MAFMKSKGFDVLMVSANGPELEKVIEREDCAHVVIPFTRRITPVKDFVCLLQLIQLIKKEKPDVVHSHTPKAGLLAMLAAKFSRVPVKLHTVAGLPLMTAVGFKKRLLTWIEKLTSWAADKVLVNSHSLKDYIINHDLCRIEKLDIIGKGSTNGIDLKRFSKSELDHQKLKEIKDSITYDPECRYILSVGRIVKDKGIEELMNGFQSLTKEYQKLKLILIGPLEEIRSEEQLSSKTLSYIKNDDSVLHIPWSEEVEYYFHIANVFVQASHREGFPNVTLQAGAMNCPIVCSDIPGNIDIVTDGKTGLHFNVARVDSLTEKIRVALEDSELMDSMAQTLRREIEQKFDRKLIHGQIFEFYSNQIEQLS